MSEVGDLILLYRNTRANGNGAVEKKGEGRVLPVGMGVKGRKVKERL
jgi:hypothetical protein